MDYSNIKKASNVAIRIFFILSCLAASSSAKGITTSFAGPCEAGPCFVTFDWDAGLSDLRLSYIEYYRIFGTDTFGGATFRYDTTLLNPTGEIIPVAIKLPWQFAQNSGNANWWDRTYVELYSPAGTNQRVYQTEPDPITGAYKDVMLSSPNTFVDYAISENKEHPHDSEAFRFYINEATHPNSLNGLLFEVIVGTRWDISFLLGLLGKEVDNLLTEFIKEESCPVPGFPRYSVNTSTLNMVVEDTEFSEQNLGPQLTSARTWNAVPTLAGMFGNGWSYDYESTLIRSCGGARVTFGGGQALTYSASLCPGSSLAYPVTVNPPAGNYDQLSYMNGDYWLLKKMETKETLRYDPVALGSDKYRLTSITDRNNNSLTISYSTSGSISRITDAVGRHLDFTYDTKGHAIRMDTPLNLSATFNYDAGGNLIRTVDLYGTVIDYSYDASNYMTSMSYAGKTFRFSYDSSGGWIHVASVTDPEGKTQRFRGYKNEYDPTLGASVNGSDATDTRGNITRYIRDGAGRTLMVIDPKGYKNVRSYTAGGQLQSIKDARGNITSFSFDSRGNLLSTTDPSGKVESNIYDGNDNLLIRTDRLGKVWTNTYDAKGNLIISKTPTGKTTTITYNSKGQPTVITDPNGNATQYEYDTFGNQNKRTDPLGKVTTFDYGTTGLDPIKTNDANNRLSQMTYDANRRLTQLLHPDGTHSDNQYDGCAMTGRTDENGHTASIVRDGLLREVSLTQATGAITQKAYDGNGNEVSVTNPLGLTNFKSYDAVNHIASMTNPLGGVLGFAHDEVGNITAVTDENNQTTTLAYDVNNRLSSMTDPLTNRVAYTRDAAGKITQVTNARAGIMTMDYNDDGQLFSRSHDGINESYQYDNAANMTGYRSSTLGNTTYSYNARNEITNITYPDGKNVAFAYDNKGNLQSISYPNGVTLTYALSNRDWVSGLQWGSNSVNFTYDGVGNVLTEVRSNGTTSLFTYDSADRFIRIEHKRGATAFASLQYERDTAGNTVREISSLPVTKSWTATQHTLSYDVANQVSADNGVFYAYDKDGNPTSSDLQNQSAGRYTASYDQLNRLTTLTVSNAPSTFAYDPQGNRTQASRNGVVTRYYHDAQGRLLFEAATNGQLRYYFYQGSWLVAMQDGSASYFFHYDKLGSTIAITDTAGNLLNSYTYTPFGQVTGSSEGVSNRFKYVGAYGVMDEGNGFYFMKNRYYDAKLGRFLQRDPIGFSGGQSNLYRYVANNPIDNIDPSGLALGNTSELDVAEMTAGLILDGLGAWALTGGAAVVSSATGVGLLIGGAALTIHGIYKLTNDAIGVAADAAEKSGQLIWDCKKGIYVMEKDYHEEIYKNLQENFQKSKVREMVNYLNERGLRKK